MSMGTSCPSRSRIAGLIHSLVIASLIPRISLAAPSTGNVWQVTAGQAFDLTINGTGLAIDDRIRLVASAQHCGEDGAEVVSSAVASADTVTGEAQSSVGSDPADLTSVTWTGVVVKRVEELRVCWCSSSASGCSAGADFGMSVGLIMTDGPTLAIALSVAPEMPFAIQVRSTLGWNVSATDRIRIVTPVMTVSGCGSAGSEEQSPYVADEVCWTDPCVPSGADDGPSIRLLNDNATWEAVWQPIFLTREGDFLVCFCADGQGDCNDGEDFNIELGTIDVEGVTSGQWWYCSATVGCAVDIGLNQGASAGDAVQLVEETASARCGQEAASPASFSMGSRTDGAVTVNGGGAQVVAFDFGEPQVPGTYLVCFCRRFDTDSCAEDIDFFQTAGSLLVTGLSDRDAHHMCYLRSDCILNIYGSGLVAEDALILNALDHPCGDTGSLAALRLSTEGGGFEMDGSGYMYIGTFAGSAESGTQRWTYALGPPLTSAMYRVCYCNARRGFCVQKGAFDIAAGELVVRGTEVLSDANCEQGASCTATLRSVQFHQQDAILLLYYAYQCGDDSAEARPSWSSTIFPSNIEEYVFTPGLWDATFELLVAEPGRYRLCYCAHVDDPAYIGCHDDGGDPIVSQFSHDAGRVRVQGIVETVSEVTSNVTGPLPGSPASLTVEVVSQSTGVRITCAATAEATTGDYVPLMSDVQNCTVAEFLLPGGTSAFPRCWGMGTTPHTVEQGTNLVHIPLAAGLTSGALPDDMHVWCYSDFPCSNDRCVTPATSVGTLIRITRGITVSDVPQEVLVSTPFAWRLEVTSAFDIGEHWPRIKLIERGRNCRTAPLHSGIVGLSGTCEVSGAGKCEQEPQVLWTTGVGGSIRELVWSDIEVPEVGEYDVCYCDRHYSESCALWQNAGWITASGPLSVGQYNFEANPDEDFVVFVEGSELSLGDRIMVLYTGGGSNTQAPTTTTTESTEPGNSTNDTRRLTVPAWFSRQPFSINETGQYFDVQISTTGNYEIYWCSGNVFSCQIMTDFTVYLGPLSVQVEVDCEVTDWWIATSCSRPCGGGKMLKSRAIITEAQAGGTPCPEELSVLDDCNVDACPLADIRSMQTLPSRVVIGEAFAVVMEGDWLNPDEDWVLIVGAGESCGTSSHYGGAQCNEQGGNQQQLICGNGRSTIRIDAPGQYRVCVCDGSAATIPTQQGDHVTVGLAGNLSSAGCESPLFFQISPEGGGYFEIHASAIAAPQAEDDDGLQDWHIVLIFSSSLVLILLMLAACWAAFGKEQMQKMRAKKTPDIEESSIQEQRQPPLQQQRAIEPPPPMQALPAPAPTPEPQQRMDMQTLAWYEAHYQALGYPPGTAYMQFGHLVGNPQQLALTNGMDMGMNPMSGPMIQPSTSMPLMQQQPSWNTFNPPAMNPLPLPALMPPPTPPILPAAGTTSPRSLMARPGSSTFADRATEANKRPATPPGAVNFRNLDLSPMPSQRGGDTTPRADSTPHGDATPRGSPPAPFTGGDDAQSEDGAPAPLRGHFPRATSKEERPQTGNSMQSGTSFVLSESSNESPRPLTTSALKAHDSVMGKEAIADRVDKMKGIAAPTPDRDGHAEQAADDAQEVVDLPAASESPPLEVPQPPEPPAQDAEGERTSLAADAAVDDMVKVADSGSGVATSMDEAPALPPEPPQPPAAASRAPSADPPDSHVEETMQRTESGNSFDGGSTAGGPGRKSRTLAGMVAHQTDAPLPPTDSSSLGQTGGSASQPVIPGLPLGAGLGPNLGAGPPLPLEPRAGLSSSVSGMALPPPPPPPKLAGPGPQLQLDQFEDTMHSTASDNPWERSTGSNAVPESPLSGSGAGGRKTFSLAGLAKSQGAAASKLPRSPTGASHSQHKPKKPVISTRSPQQFAKPEMAPPPPPSQLPGSAQPAPSAARGSTQTSLIS